MLNLYFKHWDFVSISISVVYLLSINMDFFLISETSSAPKETAIYSNNLLEKFIIRSDRRWIIHSFNNSIHWRKHFFKKRNCFIFLFFGHFGNPNSFHFSINSLICVVIPNRFFWFIDAISLNIFDVLFKKFLLNQWHLV